MMGSSSEMDLRSIKMLPMIGKVKGPGGRLWIFVLMLVGGKKMRMINHISIAAKMGCQRQAESEVIMLCTN